MTSVSEVETLVEELHGFAACWLLDSSCCTK